MSERNQHAGPPTQGTEATGGAPSCPRGFWALRPWRSPWRAVAGVRRAWPLAGLSARVKRADTRAVNLGGACRPAPQPVESRPFPQDAPPGPQQKERSSGARAGEQSPCVLFWDRDPVEDRAPFNTSPAPSTVQGQRGLLAPGGRPAWLTQADDSEIAHKDGHGHWASLGVGFI